MQVYDIGEADGEYFIAMEYVHGEDVRKILSTARASAARTCRSATRSRSSRRPRPGCTTRTSSCGADKQPLDIVHRDVSPSNILVGYDGSIKVVDFGIAKASMRAGDPLGHASRARSAYMSPEQCIGEPVDRRSDVFALGIVLYELATTTRLFKGENDYLTMEQVVHGRSRRPGSRRPDLPDELSAIIMRALATDRNDRYASADELRIALDQFASRAALTAPPSAIATYMREVFGQRLEPWLEPVMAPAPDDDAPTIRVRSVTRRGVTAGTDRLAARLCNRGDG